MHNPSLIRCTEQNKIKDILQYESWLIEQYGKYSSQYLPTFFTPLDWVASAHHFGLPTRLIDWTFDPFCALYFSLFNRIEDGKGEYTLLVVNKNEHLYFEDVPNFELDVTQRNNSNNSFVTKYQALVNGIAGLNLQLLNRIYRHGSPQEKFVNRIKEALEEENKNPVRHYLFFCSIYDSNPRIIAQKGLFQILRNLNFDKKNGEFYNKQLTKNGCERIYKIDSDSRESLLEKLKRINVITPRLFPDLQNICEYIKKEIPSFS